VKTRRVGLVSPYDIRKTLHNEWGLALALESRIGGDTRQILLDFGYTPNAYLNNMEILGVNPARTQGLIASHGHYDHFGGLIGSSIPPSSRRPADVHRRRGPVLPAQDGGTPGPSPTGASWIAATRQVPHPVVSCEQPTVISVTVSRPARSSARASARAANTMVEYFKRDGVGCDIPSANAKAQGKPVPDEHIHEHGTCFNVKDRGLVVISSCGHAGIINTARQAMQVSGVKKLHAALGGFHLFPAPDDYVAKTVAEFKALDPDVIIPMHCSGPNLVALLRTELADRVITSATGTEYAFGA
jgi:7,8-dihydropterin-6-yl-methyl-4-(beta-D-ribofuranosyl)aminobenzene 5'-phosphate synthase